MSSSARVFRHPIGAFERTLRKLYDRAMRSLRLVPYTAHAQGARFVVDTDDLIDRELAVNAIWEASQLEDFAALCLSHRIDYFLDIGANAGVYSVLLAQEKSRRRDHCVRARSRQSRATGGQYRRQ